MATTPPSDRSSALTWLRWVLLGLALSALLSVATVLLSTGSRIATGQWVQQHLAIKRQAFLGREPTLVLLGGSNVLYGLSAAQLTQAHHVPALNLGVHVGLGLSYILDDGRRYVGPGRVLVLALEYELYADRVPDPALAEQVLGFEPSAFWALDPASQAYLLFGMPLAERLRHLVAARGGEQAAPARGEREVLVAMNDWGDAIDHGVAARTPGMLADVQSAKPATFEHGPGAWRQIAAFAARAREGGARVVIAYPNLYARVMGRANAPFLAELLSRAARLGIPVVGTPEENLFGDDLVWNTKYHPTLEGQFIATERLYRNLAASGALPP